jgi:hypothetical protein
VTNEYSRRTPPYGVRCAGTVGAHRCCGCGVAPPERPSPLWLCSVLSFNTLTGSVPSSLSALTNLCALCVPPSCQRRLRVRPRRVGSVGTGPSARHVAGCMSGASSGAVRQQGCCGALRGDPCTRCDFGVLKAHHSYGVRCAGTVGAHRCCGCGVVPPSGQVRFGCADTSRTIN